MMVAMYGNIGQLILFFVTLISAVLVGLFTVTYAAHCFLTIVEDTAAGNEEVRWPDEPPTDWYGKPFFVGWLLLVPIVPASLLLLVSEAEFLQTPLGKLGVILAASWLFFPLCLWSALGANSTWHVVHFGMYRRIFQHPGILGLFYLLTAPIPVLGVALVYYGITKQNMFWLPMAAIGVSALLFIYARLAGRVAWLACQGLPVRKKKKQRRLRGVKAHDPWAAAEELEQTAASEAIVAAPDPPTKPRSKPAGAITAIDPWAVPDEPPLPPTFSPAELEVEDEWAPNKKPYGLASSADASPLPPPAMTKPQPVSEDDEEDEWTPNKKPYALKDYVAESQEKIQPAARARENADDDDEDEWTPNKKPYGLQKEEATSNRSEETRITARAPSGPEERIQSTAPAADSPPDAPELPTPSRLDMQIYLEPYKPFVPRWTLFSGVWEFPIYALSARALVYLSALAFVLGLLIRALLILWIY
jgi:hypothetical protein